MELLWLFVIGSTIWMAYDAAGNKVPVDSKPYSLNNGALAWFLSGVLLWIAAFPYYLYKRSKVLSSREIPFVPTSPQPSSADELLKFKRLLDAGAITQDEYDAKKRQILGT